MERKLWLTLLGEFWTNFDDIGRHRRRLREELGTKGPLATLMTEDEVEQYGSLPDIVTCYRGCGRHNMLGASWSLERRVANSFPFTNRYRCSEPLPITGRVRKRNILAIKLDREETEIISFSVRQLHVESADRLDAKAPMTRTIAKCWQISNRTEGGYREQVL